MSYNKLPADPTALILGIVGLVIILPGCCCGLLTIVSLILGIIGVVLAGKSKTLYANDPENYHHKSWNNVKLGNILCVVVIVISVLTLAAQASLLLFNGEKFSREFWEDFGRKRGFDYEINSKDSMPDWSNDANVRLKKQGDSIYLDTITADSTIIK